MLISWVEKGTAEAEEKEVIDNWVWEGLKLFEKSQFCIIRKK